MYIIQVIYAFWQNRLYFLAETSVFVLKGQDVRLNVQTNVQLKEDVDVLYWKFDTSVNVVKYPPKVTFERYRGRAECSEEDFSLLLKNLQEEDSGLYEAVNKQTIKELYLFSERVEPPVLTVDSVSSINGTCNVTVACRGQNTSVNSSCNSSTCSQVGGERRRAETTTVPLLSVYVAGGSIICNHSNQVSWANDTKEIKTICLEKGKTDLYKHRPQAGSDGTKLGDPPKHPQVPPDPKRVTETTFSPYLNTYQRSLNCQYLMGPELSEPYITNQNLLQHGYVYRHAASAAQVPRPHRSKNNTNFVSLKCQNSYKEPQVQNNRTPSHDLVKRTRTALVSSSVTETHRTPAVTLEGCTRTLPRQPNAQTHRELWQPG
uniref:Immunoglobulin V-set domain-containing protein n=1 Tax=Oncorhynchus mykiss TaxID=8022 RepID=A0A8C7S8E7_ONCMY